MTTGRQNWVGAADLRGLLCDWLSDQNVGGRHVGGNWNVDSRRFVGPTLFVGLVCVCVWTATYGKARICSHRFLGSTNRCVWTGLYTTPETTEEIGRRGISLVKTFVTTVSGWKSSRDRIQRIHHVSDGSLWKILCTTRIATGTGSRRCFLHNVR